MPSVIVFLNQPGLETTWAGRLHVVGAAGFIAREDRRRAGPLERKADAVPGAVDAVGHVQAIGAEHRGCCGGIRDGERQRGAAGVWTPAGAAETLAAAGAAAPAFGLRLGIVSAPAVFGLSRSGGTSSGRS